MIILTMAEKIKEMEDFLNLSPFNRLSNEDVRWLIETLKKQYISSNNDCSNESSADHIKVPFGTEY